MQPLPRVDVIDLFAPLRADLLALLESLTAEQWGAMTVCDPWTVKDLAAHMLADDVGVVARRVHGWPGAWFAGDDWDELVAFIDEQNATWVRAMRRVAPAQIVAMLRASGPPLYGYFRTLDLDAMGGPVNWAGPQPAPVWLDVAREYTEQWHHGQQIRDAVGAPPAYQPRLFAPVLATFIRALPHTYRNVAAPEGTHVRLVIEGDAGLACSLVRSSGVWVLYTEGGGHPAAAVTLPQDRAWRLFTRGIGPDDARARIEGDTALGEVALRTLSILA